MKINSFSVVHGFIKTNFNTCSNNSNSYGYGSIMDGIYKLEIQITNYEQDNYFKKGEEVEIKGYVKMASELR